MKPADEDPLHEIVYTVTDDEIEFFSRKANFELEKIIKTLEPLKTWGQLREAIGTAKYKELL